MPDGPDGKIIINSGDLVLNKEGRWLFRGGEITHAGIVAALWNSFERLESGGYVIRQGKFYVPVVVEDAPYVVESTRDDDGVVIILSDSSREKLDPDNFWISDEHVPYTLVKGEKFLARFSRTAYSQLFDKLQEEGGRYYMRVGGKLHEIKKGRPNL